MLYWGCQPSDRLEITIDNRIKSFSSNGDETDVENEYTKISKFLKICLTVFRKRRRTEDSYDHDGIRRLRGSQGTAEGGVVLKRHGFAR
jgi:hypothetical protein